MISQKLTQYRAYVDTSVFGGTQDNEFKEASTLFFEAVHEGRYRVLVSPPVLEELMSAPKAVRDVFDAIPAKWQEIVEEDERARTLAEAYIEAGVLTKKSRMDALHVAIATIAKADVIVSWNFKHIVNFDRIRKFNGVNALQGFGSIDIRSPLEVTNVKEK